VAQLAFGVESGEKRKRRRREKKKKSNKIKKRGAQLAFGWLWLNL
jgi:hypothetical protein